MAAAPPQPLRPLSDALAQMPDVGVDSDFARALEELPLSRKSGGLVPVIDPGSNRSLLDAADEFPTPPVNRADLRRLPIPAICRRL